MERVKIIRWIIGAIAIGIIIAGLLFYRFIIPLVIISFIFAYLISPIIKYAEIYHIPRTISILLVYIIILALIVLLIYVILPQIKNQVEEFLKFVKHFQETISSNQEITFHSTLQSIGLSKLSQFIKVVETKFTFIDINKYSKELVDKLIGLIGKIPQFILTSISSIINILAFLVVIPFVSFFLLKDERRLLRKFFSWIPNRFFEFSIYLFEKIEESFGRYFRAILIETIIIWLLTFIGLLILKIPYALTLSIIVGITNPIKFFGPFIGFIPIILVILFGPTPEIYIIYAIILSLIIQQFDSNILFPHLVGENLGMHPLWVLLTVIAGGYAFGVLGLIFAVPVVFLIKTIVQVSSKSLKKFEII
ncbi:MAG: AI-2E family transporter [Candidatus Cloacimonetes bacterium]|nr:AI-2E family transporter [Candidatus Cloacimonadota bacterium]MBL7086788.1 AI-2E family transporter [Candidatus Cloacimonadota bacterium]